MPSVRCKFVEGLASSERIAKITTKNGTVEEVPVSSRNIEEESLEVGRIGSDPKQGVLIELPRESLNGRWRLWVEEAQMIEDKS